RPTTRQDVLIALRLRASRLISKPAYGISISNEHGILMTCVNTVELGAIMPELPAGESNIIIRIKHISFMPGVYTARFWAMSPQLHIYAMSEDDITIEIVDGQIYGTSQVDHRWGIVYS